MSGIETIVNFGCISDEQRWDANRYKWEWLSKITDSDKKIISLLDCLADGEFSGQASAAQMYNLISDEVKLGYDRDLLNDWGEILAYINIIVYEEMRHGLALGILSEYAKNGESEYISKLNRRTFSEKYIWCYEDRKYWNLYSYALAHLFGEVVNTELYRDIKDKIQCDELRQVVTNIMTDEARHTRAWTSLIKDLAESHPEHMRRLLDGLEEGLVYHNAMVHETYFEGQNKMMSLFSASSNEEEGAIDRIVKRKFKILNEIFGSNNNYSMEEIKKSHMSFLLNSLGESRAVFSKSSDNKIAFI